MSEYELRIGAENYEDVEFLKEMVGQMGERYTILSEGAEQSLPVVDTDIIRRSNFLFDTKSGEFTRTDKEFKSIMPRLPRDLFAKFARRPQHVFTNDEIFEFLQERSKHEIGRENVRVQMKRIRGFISDDDEEAMNMIVSFRKKGYMLIDESVKFENIEKGQNEIHYHAAVKKALQEQFEKGVASYGNGVSLTRLDEGVEARVVPSKNETDTEFGGIEKYPVYDKGRIYFDPNTHIFKNGDHVITLSTRFMELVQLMVTNQGSIITKEAVANHFAGNKPLSESSINMVVLRLRKAITDSGRLPDPIKPVRGKGYTWEA